jgi:hypothetical protein
MYIIIYAIEYIYKLRTYIIVYLINFERLNDTIEGSFEKYQYKRFSQCPVKHHASKTYGGGSIVPTVLTLGIRSR